MSKKNEPRAWIGDWHQRIDDGVIRLGFASLDHFFLARPGRGYEALARELGEDVAPLQLVWRHLRECRGDDEFLDRAADSLMRHLVEHLKRGWMRGVNFEFNVVSAIVTWSGEVERAGHRAGTRQLTESVIRALRQLSIPEGWLPSTREDNYIKDAFHTALASSSS